MTIWLWLYTVSVKQFWANFETCSKPPEESDYGCHGSVSSKCSRLVVHLQHSVANQLRNSSSSGWFGSSSAIFSRWLDPYRSVVAELCQVRVINDYVTTHITRAICRMVTFKTSPQPSFGCTNLPCIPPFTKKEYQVSSEYCHKHSWISQHPPLFLCSRILTPSNTSNDSNALPGEIGISSNLMPWLPWESSILEYNRLVNLLVIKKGVLSWDLWRMKDPSELTKNMFLFGCFCSIVSQLTADRTKQTQLFGTRPQNHDHLPKTQISFLNKKLFLLSIFSVRRCDYWLQR